MTETCSVFPVADLLDKVLPTLQDCFLQYRWKTHKEKPIIFLSLSLSSPLHIPKEMSRGLLSSNRRYQSTRTTISPERLSLLNSNPMLKRIPASHSTTTAHHSVVHGSHWWIIRDVLVVAKRWRSESFQCLSLVPRVCSLHCSVLRSPQGTPGTAIVDPSVRQGARVPGSAAIN